MAKRSMTDSTPPALKDELLVAYLEGEAVVFDRATNQGHALNGPATAVYRGLHEGRGLDEVAASIGSPVVGAALHEFHDAGLLRPGSTLPRRAALRGLAAIAVPTVVSALIPAAADAQSLADCSTFLDQTSCPTPRCMWLVDMCVPEPVS